MRKLALAYPIAAARADSFEELLSDKPSSTPGTSIHALPLLGPSRWRELTVA
jgi:hypothetical protein